MPTELSGGAAAAARWLERRAGPIAAGVALLLVLGGAAYSTALGPSLRYPDEREYLDLAIHLVEGRGFSADGRSPTAFRPPGYPVALASVALLTDSAVALRLVNFVLLAGCALLVGLLLRRHGRPLAAALAPLGLLAYPVLPYTAGTLYPQTLGAFGLLLLLWLLTDERERAGSMAGAGVVLGGLVLTIPTFAFMVLPVAGWLATRRSGGRARALAACLVPACLVVGAWSLRNEAAVGAPVFVSSNSGFNLLLGNSENTTPNAGVNVDVRRYLREAGPLGEVDRDAFLGRRALEWIEGHPLEAGRLYLAKVANYLNYRNELFVRSEGTSLADVGLGVTYGVLLALALARLMVAPRWPLSAFEILLSSTYALSALATAIAFTRIRFRVPFDLLLILQAAILVEIAVSAVLGRRSASPEGTAATDQ